MSEPRSRVIVSGAPRRETIIAVSCGLIVLGFILFAVYVMSREQGANSTNQLTGTIVAKHASGDTEKEITFGKKGLKSRVAESGYSFEIQVKPGDHPYEVPVSKGLFDSRKVGDRQSFIRPPSEQR